VQASSLHFATAAAASLIFPFAPHCGSEVYDMVTGERVWEQPWPAADPALLERDTVTYAIQVNGKLRDTVDAPPAMDRSDLEALAREQPNVGARLDGHEVVKVIVVPGKLVNFVVR
jgi:leucyl-tRNA synthetase